MRKKELKLVITFASTAKAMAAEKSCKEVSAPGRLIPVPTQITAGCGLAWMADVEEKETILQVFAQNQIDTEGIYEILI